MTGTWTANADGTYADDTITTGNEQFTLGALLPGHFVDPGQLQRGGQHHHQPGVLVAHLHVGGGRRVHLLGDRPADWRARVGLRRADDQRQLHALGQLRSRSPATSGDTQYDVLRLGEHVDDDPAEHEPHHDGHHRAPEERRDRDGRHDGNGRRDGGSAVRRGQRRAAGTGGDGNGRPRRAGARLGRGGASGHGGHGRQRAASGGGRRRHRRTGGAAGSGASVGPCDIYANAGNPCVAAHSTVRALFGAYSGKLYQVRNTAGTTKDILTLTPGGFADGGSQDAFCSGTTCVITVVYDQSGKGNDLWYQGSTMVPGSTSSTPFEGDQRVADAQRSQGLLALHQPEQQLLGRRLEVGHRARQSDPKGCTW